MRLFHFISEKQFALDVIADQRLKVSRLNDLNDPFELNAVTSSDKQFLTTYNKFKNEMAIYYGILCFSKSWKSPLLWSHYANRHKGVAIEFDVLDSVAHSISYRKNRYFLSDPKQNGKHAGFRKKDILGIWLTKYKEWEYEEEVRMILRISECIGSRKNYYYPLGKDINLRGIVLGSLCDIEVNEIKDKLPSNQRISVTKARLASRSFNIVKEERFRKIYLSGKLNVTNT